MKRFLYPVVYLVVLMALGSSAQAGNSLSFVIGGHRIQLEASQDCRMVRQHLQPQQRQHLLRDHRHEGSGFASGRSLRARPVFLFRQCLEPDRW